MQAISLTNGKVQFEISVAHFKEHISRAISNADTLLAAAKEDFEKFEELYKDGDSLSPFPSEAKVEMWRAEADLLEIQKVEATINMITAETFVATSDFVEPVISLSLCDPDGDRPR